MMKRRESSQLIILGFIFIFFLALIPRINQPSARFNLWYGRANAFWNGLKTGHLEETYQQYHPGVTTMWVAGTGIEAYKIASGLGDDEIPSTVSTNPREPAAQAGLIAMGLVISGSIVLIVFLLSRMTRWLVAFTAGFLLALDPFYITHSKLIHVDAFLATFMLVSALAWIAFLRLEQRRYLVLSGIFGGLAVLTKSPSYYLLPFIGLVALIQALTDGRWFSSGSLNSRAIGLGLWRIFVSVGAWLVIVVVMFFALWPAAWFEPIERLSQVFRAVLLHAGRSHPNPVFFAGRIIEEDPGALFYMATLAWQTTAITLLGVLLAVYFLVRKLKSGQDTRLWWYLLLYAAGFVLFMTLGAKKSGRYILPAIVAIDVLAAWAIVEAADYLAPKFRLAAVKRRPALLVMALLLIQALLILRYQPHFGTHFNQLLGGGRVAQHILPLGLQGEGMDEAADILNGIRGVDRFIIARPFGSGLMFRTKFIGEMGAENADFTLFHIIYRQRRKPAEDVAKIWETCQQEGPAWTVSYDGVPYVWICRTYPRNPDSYAMEQERRVDLGQQIAMLGYDLSPAVARPGEMLAVKLYWQSDGQVTADRHVFVHLINEAGELVAQSDGAPVRGERPTWSWLEDEIVEDTYALEIPPALEPGLYTVSAGMYDYESQVRLPAFEPGAGRLIDDRIVLGDVQVISP
jgi:hypothetical protein